MNLGAGGEGRERMKPKISLCLEIRRKSFCDSRAHFEEVFHSSSGKVGAILWSQARKS